MAAPRLLLTDAVADGDKIQHLRPGAAGAVPGYPALPAFRAAPYDGPFKVIARGAKTMTVDRGSRHDVVSLDRVKPAHLEESVPTPTWPSSSRRETTDTEYTEDEELGWLLAQPETPPPAPPPAAPASILRTRAGRIPREPDRLQVGSMAAQNNDSGVAKRVRFRL